MKIGPVISMGVVIGLTVWIMAGVTAGPKISPLPGSATFEVVIAREKMTVEQIPLAPAGGGAGRGYEYRFLSGPRAGQARMTEADFQGALSEMSARPGSSKLLRFFNVTSYANLLWVALGLGGQACFSGRMIVQWLTSERRRESIVPPVFWYMSFGGGLMMAVYFVWRQDVVGVLGQATGLVVYARNIRLLYVRRTRSGQGETRPETVSDGERTTA